MADSTSQQSNALDRPQLLEAARLVFATESEAIAGLSDRLDGQFVAAVDLVIGCRGRVVVTGIGKSGAIGRKIASTLASTGTPALFLHAAEGLHGDLGMIAPGDVVLAISYSGRNDELTSILPVVKDMGISIIALTGNLNSYLAAHADVILNIAVTREACPLNLAPTASTAATLAMGDALAVCAMGERRFTSSDFARFHPGGTLGRGLKLLVRDLMRTGDRLAVVTEGTLLLEALKAINEAQAGAVMVIDSSGRLTGYFTDGDVRRHLVRDGGGKALLGTPIDRLMTRTPLTLLAGMTALEALRALQERRVDDAPVVDGNDKPIGWLDEQELLRAGVV